MWPRKWTRRIESASFDRWRDDQPRPYAVKICPGITAPSTVHVLDASRAVGVVNSLLNEQIQIRVRRQNACRLCASSRGARVKTREKKFVTIEQARANRTPIDGAIMFHPTGMDRPRASRAPPSAISKIISIGRLLSHLGAAGRYPAIFDDPVIGKQARELSMMQKQSRPNYLGAIF